MNCLNFERMSSFKKGILKLGAIYKTNKKGFNDDREFLVIEIFAKKSSWAWFGGHAERRKKIAAKIINEVVKKHPNIHVVIDFFGNLYEKNWR